MNRIDEAGEDEGHRHDDRRVVGQHRADQQRADAGNAEDLLGDDGAAEHDRHLQRDQRHDRDQRVAHDVLAITTSLSARPFERAVVT